MRSFGNRRIC